MNPLLILHGALGSSSQLDPVKLFFENQGRKVHTLNFSGHGGTPFQSDFGIDQFTTDTFQYLESHQLKQVDIFGCDAWIHHRNHDPRELSGKR